MQILYTILNILLFIICLGVLIMIHELGHLATAKMFKVYCFEYSIGFGPALFRKKRKKGETYVAIRAIPFGGYVSMYGEAQEEGTEFPDGITNVPESRALNKIKKWKAAIVMFAGIFLNAVLALVLFFVSNTCFVQKKLDLTMLQVSEGSLAAQSGITLDSVFAHERIDQENKTGEGYVAYNSGFLILDKSSIAHYSDDSEKQIAVLMNFSQMTFKSRSFDNYMAYYVVNDENVIDYSQRILPSDENLVSIDVNLHTCHKDEIVEGEAIPFTTKTINLEVVTGEKDVKSFAKMGIDLNLLQYWNNFGQAVKNTFTDFGESSVMIAKALGGLFIGKGWSDVGGPVAIFNQTSSTLANFGVSYFIRLWAIISVNLAIFNLLPFPGLDGWQILVIAIEGITKKEVPAKAKAIMSTIGMVLLFALMGFVLIKDIIGLF